MVVRANDLALFDLREDEWPRLPGRDHRVDLFCLVALVIEVQHHDVSLSAVDARMRGQVLKDVLPSLVPYALPTRGPRRVVPILGLRVVGGVVGLLAHLAHAAVTIGTLLIDRKVVERLFLLALVAALHIKSLPD